MDEMLPPPGKDCHCAECGADFRFVHSDPSVGATECPVCGMGYIHMIAEHEVLINGKEADIPRLMGLSDFGSPLLFARWLYCGRWPDGGWVGGYGECPVNCHEIWEQRTVQKDA